MRSLAKFMQFAGLTILPLGIFMEISGNLPRRYPIAGLLLMMVFGVCLFQLGRYIEGYSAKG